MSQGFDPPPKYALLAPLVGGGQYLSATGTPATVHAQAVAANDRSS
jgi:hypothetical protein